MLVHAVIERNDRIVERTRVVFVARGLKLEVAGVLRLEQARKKDEMAKEKKKRETVWLNACES
jgi:hypothetical protein